MTKEENISFMKSFFEKYYKKLHDDDLILVSLPGVPEPMISETDKRDGECKVWKLIPSTVTEEKLQEVEKAYNIKFPDVLKAFFSVYHHLFDAPIGSNSIKAPLQGFEFAFNSKLAKNGFLPFAWDEDGFFIRCIDLSNMPDEEKCSVVEIDHEVMFDLIFKAEDNNKTVSREEFAENMKTVAVNFYDFLNGVYEGRIE